MDQSINIKKFGVVLRCKIGHIAQLVYSNRQYLCSDSSNRMSSYWLAQKFARPRKTMLILKLFSSVVYNACTLLSYMAICAIKTIYSERPITGCLVWRTGRKTSGFRHVRISDVRFTTNRPDFECPNWIRTFEIRTILSGF